MTKRALINSKCLIFCNEPFKQRVVIDQHCAGWHVICTHISYITMMWVPVYFRHRHNIICLTRLYICNMVPTRTRVNTGLLLLIYHVQLYNYNPIFTICCPTTIGIHYHILMRRVAQPEACNAILAIYWCRNAYALCIRAVYFPQ